MAKDLLISIITVNYNDAIGLEKTIQSVKSQTYRNFEHIVIDGNSDDGSKAIIEKHKDSFSYWVSEPDSGIYNAMNKGIKVAKGEYLLFLNSGDWLFSNEVLTNVSDEINGNIDIYYGDLNFVNSEGTGKIKKYPGKLTFFYFFNKGHLPHPASFTKRSLFSKLGGYREKFKIVADWDFYVTAICKWDASYKHIDKIITNFDTNGLSGKSENRGLLLDEKTISLADNFLLFIDDNNRLMQIDLFEQSKEYVLLNNINNRFFKQIHKLWLKVLTRFIK